MTFHKRRTVEAQQNPPVRLFVSLFVQNRTCSHGTDQNASPNFFPTNERGILLNFTVSRLLSYSYLTEIQAKIKLVLNLLLLYFNTQHRLLQSIAIVGLEKRNVGETRGKISDSWNVCCLPEQQNLYLQVSEVPLGAEGCF